jgi:DNA-directed RNA polymerase beta' subunit
MKAVIVNFDSFYDPEKVVTNHKPAANGVFTEDGVFSPKIFGSLENALYYSCKCGETRGLFLEGVSCEVCHTPVKAAGSPFDHTGWIDFQNFYFIHPLFYNFIEKIIPDLSSIINYQLNIDKEGNEVVVSNEDKNTNKLHNIGMKVFHKNFMKILNYYYSNSPKKAALTEYYEFILENFDKVFINKFPIYAVNLRPAILRGTKLIFDRINDYYNKILYNTNIIIQNAVLHPKFYLPLLYVNQINLNKIFNYIINNISGKAGILRNNLLGCRVNFSMRSVIIPADSDKDIDELAIPYIGFLELYKFQIIRAMVIKKTIDYNAAHKLWYKALGKFDTELYNTILEPMLQTADLHVLLNRK